MADPRENALAGLTNVWTLPFLVRTYESNPKGEAAFAEEAAILARHQYQPLMQTAEGSHLHAGRLILTGGLSVFAGGRGIRSKGKLTVTFQKVAEPIAEPVAKPVDRKCPHCAEMIKREAKVCRYCGRESEPWMLHQGRWWVKRPDGEYWLDERMNAWVRYEPPAGSRSDG